MRMSNSNSIIQDMNGGRVLKYEGTLPLPSLPDRNYASLMLEIFAQHGRKIAVVDTVTGETFSYEDLRRVALSTQRGLMNAGVRKGDAVIILTETYSCYHAALLGVMLSGVVAVSCRADLMKEDLVHRIRVTRAKWVITAECAERNVEAAFRELGSDHLKKMWVIGKASGKDLFFGEAKNSDKPMAVDNNFDAATTCALIYFSSGTTGLPKGVKISHKNLTAYYYMYRYLEDIEEIPERSFCGIVTLIPFCPVSTYGYTICMKAFSKGHKVVILENFIPGEYLRAIEKYKATFLMTFPHMIKELVEYPITGKYDLSSVVAGITGSAPVDKAILDAFKRKFNAYVIEGYGLTETTAVLTCNGTQMGYKLGSVGIPTPFNEVKIVDPVTGCMLSEGQNGEICTRGPCIMMGYANNPEATAGALDAEGWLHTGDIGYYDSDNFVYLTDRVKDIIKFERQTVYPSEIETLIKKMEEVHDVAVVGVPDEKVGEVPRAWVVSKEGTKINTEVLIKFVAEHSAYYNQLRGGAETVKSLPRNPRGKVIKRQLRDSYVARMTKPSTIDK